MMKMSDNIANQSIIIFRYTFEVEDQMIPKNSMKTQG